MEEPRDKLDLEVGQVNEGSRGPSVSPPVVMDFGTHVVHVRAKDAAAYAAAYYAALSNDLSSSKHLTASTSFRTAAGTVDAAGYPAGYPDFLVPKALPITHQSNYVQSEPVSRIGISDTKEDEINELKKKIEEIDLDISESKNRLEKLGTDSQSLLDSLEQEIEGLCGTDS